MSHPSLHPLRTGVCAAFAMFTLLPALSAQRGSFSFDDSWRLRREAGAIWTVDDVHVLDLASGRWSERCSVVVQGDRILSILNDQAPGGDDSIEIEERVDGGGGYVIPGLFDLHAHSQAAGDPSDDVPEAAVCRALLDHGVTVIREIPLITEFAVDLASRIQRGTLAGPTIVPASTVFELYPQRSSRGFGDPSTAAAWVQREALAGARWIKVYNAMDLESLRAIVQTAEAHGMRVCGHSEDVPPREAIDVGMHCLEHAVSLPLSALADGQEESELITLVGSIVWRWQHTDDSRMEELLAHMRERGTAWVPTLVVLEAILERGGHVFRGQLSEEVEAGLDEAMTRAAEWAVEQHRLGGIVGCGTDFPINDVEPGHSVHRELELLVERGTASPLEAIQIGTLGSARVLGLEDLVGTVESGKLAHFLLLAEDPLEDLAAFASLELVVHDGRKHWVRD